MKANDKPTLDHLIKRFKALNTDMKNLAKHRKPEHAEYLRRATDVCDIIIQALTSLTRKLD